MPYTPTPDNKSAFTQLLKNLDLVLELMPAANIRQQLDNITWNGNDTYIAILSAGGRGRIGPNRRERRVMVHILSPEGWRAEAIAARITGSLDPGKPAGGTPSSFKSRDTLFYRISCGEVSQDNFDAWQRRILPVTYQYGEQQVS